jgi:hypothetical protein
LVPGVLVALIPKCVLCVAAYLGLGTTLGWTSAEICGAPREAAMHGFAWPLVATVAVAMAVLATKRRPRDGNG